MPPPESLSNSLEYQLRQQKRVHHNHMLRFLAMGMSGLAVQGLQRLLGSVEVRRDRKCEDVLWDGRAVYWAGVLKSQRGGRDRACHGASWVNSIHNALLDDGGVNVFMDLPMGFVLHLYYVYMLCFYHVYMLCVCFKRLRKGNKIKRN
ncbi:hypothetical protein P171DRAFT_142325 [Karstenula rhodostoma CBS 690.94]|uniref:Uncharacterized protein n=1 Tax=Karstenula rhodostoma CBS 690.94 TaxID=1392251 RepID=A0A9P4UIR5_9PLEO|nr:hypothetical protein P171DRAFT_142325 [Karstenula rhodostoma CBS 690.94]